MMALTSLIFPTLLAFSALPSSLAWDYYVDVGEDGILTFDPPYVKAKVNDTIKFQFFPDKHTLTQSSYDQPCVRSTEQGAIDTEAQNVPNFYDTEWFEYRVKDTNPMWFFSQNGDECKQGMVFAINPEDGSGKTFDSFLAKAKSVASAATSSSTSSTSSTSSIPLTSSTPKSSVNAISAAVSSDTEGISDPMGKWGPIILGLLVANLLSTLALAAFAILSYVRRNVRDTRLTYTPVRSKDDAKGHTIFDGQRYRDEERYSEQ